MGKRCGVGAEHTSSGTRQSLTVPSRSGPVEAIADLAALPLEVLPDGRLVAVQELVSKDRLYLAGTQTQVIAEGPRLDWLGVEPLANGWSALPRQAVPTSEFHEPRNLEPMSVRSRPK